LLEEHQSWTEDRARDLARRLGLFDEYAEMLAFAGRLHDEGKQAKRWQQAFNAKTDGTYAKTRGPLNVARLDGYRHEFGSLPFAAKSARLRKLPDDLQDLALHLIAAHHGFARPVISTEGCEEPPSVLENRAREVALRFARLQKRWGPWGLAWWEALLRAADQQASRDNDAADSSGSKESV
jgi:CRISPR-associated endonuclease/helicase Cas3